MAEIRHLENQHDVIFFCRGWSDLDKIWQTGTEWHVDCGDMWKWKPDVEFQYGGRLREFNGMSSQSHVSHCRVMPLGEFNITIPEPHATLQGAVTWRNQCRDRATLQGVRIPSAILKIVFRHIFFLFLMQFRLWRAAAFVSSPIHLFCFETDTEPSSMYSQNSSGPPKKRLRHSFLSFNVGRRFYCYIPIICKTYGKREH